MALNLDWMRLRAESHLKDRCQIVTVAGRNDFGSQTPESLSAPVPCRVTSVNRLPIEGEQAGSVVAVNSWRFFLPVGTVVVPENQILYQGKRYEVTDANDGMTDAALLTVNAKRVS